ncbi:hypothetical protein HNP52_002640 [Sphingomonas kyeonggiensis]|uniref:Uncharacterized protein n=1 Tax=Sphingomonas kyeonggiensis TaxID=1268553 RepID=A0A7W7K2N1_9SPHN|nr:hypothetical protein [Sphingomonas kyeonggiensis]MBB4839571.1 hypothetical protein [Sphingomonas kyeonggiensis]
MHLLLGFALVAAPLVQDDPICADLQRLSAAVADPVAYKALYRSDFAPRLLRACYRSQGYACHQSMLPPEITHETMAQRIAACLPGAVVTPGAPWPGLKRSVVTGGGLVFKLEESGSERAHVGRILHIEIGPKPKL